MWRYAREIYLTRFVGVVLLLFAFILGLTSTSLGVYCGYYTFIQPTLDYSPNCTASKIITTRLTCHGSFAEYPSNFILATIEVEAKSFELCSFNYHFSCEFPNRFCTLESTDALEAVMLLTTNQTECWYDKVSSKVYLTPYMLPDVKILVFIIVMLIMIITWCLAMVLYCAGKSELKKYHVQIHNEKDQFLSGHFAMS